jgi:hypothetical protein
MSRCQHCKKLIDSEDLIVEYDIEEHDKVFELTRMDSWIPVYKYSDRDTPREEYGKLKVGDIYIHFRHKKKKRFASGKR